MEESVMRVKLTGVLEHLEPSNLELLSMKEEEENGVNHIAETLDMFLSD